MDICSARNTVSHFQKEACFNSTFSKEAMCELLEVTKFLMENYEPSPLRPQLFDFSLAMEGKLKKNDHKQDWQEMAVRGLFKRLAIEVQELDVALEFENNTAQMDECLDCANFALILWDRLRTKNAIGKRANNDLNRDAAGWRDGTPWKNAYAVGSDKDTALGSVHPAPPSKFYRQGQWMQGNELLAEMFVDRHGSVYYEDTVHARERRLPILPAHAEVVDGVRPS